MNVIKRDRLLVLAAVFAVLLIVYAVSLYRLQIVEGEKYYKESRDFSVSTQTVSAVRGNILDRYGRLLVTNKTIHNLVVSESELFAKDVDSNAMILKLVNLFKQFGNEYNDELPITKQPPFEFTKLSDVDRARLDAYAETNKVDKEASAVEFLSSMRSRYKIDSNYSAEEARIIAGIRYAVNVRYLINTSDYVLVQDADMGLISTIRENNMLGVEVKESYLRSYSTKYAAHLLGYVGLMNDNEFEKYSSLGYSGDAKVGKDGVEYAFEKYLHGTDGAVKTTSAMDGTVISTEYTKEPIPGNNVYLSIDISLQEVAERALENTIVSLLADRGYDANGEKEDEDEEEEPQIDPNTGKTKPKVDDEITGGACVVIDCKTGGPLAIASWPSYDASTMLENYSELLSAKNSPLYNRALLGTYAPGSTFKPCAAIAALTEKAISTGTKLECAGVYTRYKDDGYTPQCWINSSGLTHGHDNVTEALRDSCNCFFYEVGYLLGIDKLTKYGKLFGLGESTGIELPENLGNMSKKETHFQYTGVEWMVGDTLQAAIGQSDSIFTPIQLAEYCSTVANRGQRYSASILKEVRSYDYAEKLFTHENVVLNEVETADYNWDAVHEGMSMVANAIDGSAYETFSTYSASTIACKTGTAQKGEFVTNDGIFICFAPLENPEIAVAVVIERGGAGANCAPVGREILESYFSIKGATDMTETEGALLK